ncbi:MAG: RraA family protein [Actinobacteria bacterium]|nr:RraA family protein [Actinomycetota bacterium]
MKKIIKSRPDIDESKIKPFRKLENVISLSCVVGDAMERDNVMKHYIKSRAADKKIVGPAITVKISPGDLVDPLDIFEVAKPGDVIVVDAFGETETSIWGGLMSGLARNAGIVGAVIDGSCRDTDEAKMLGFPIYSKVVTPRASHTAYSKRREPIEVNTTIVCGGVVVNPGDLIVGDEIGVVVVPYEALEKVFPVAKEQAEKERKIRKDILAGATMDDLLNKYGRI